MLATPCTPPRTKGIRFLRTRPSISAPIVVLRTSRSDCSLKRRLSEDPAIHLEALLRHHHMSETNASSTNNDLEDDGSSDLLPLSSKLRFSESLLLYISRHLAEVSSLLAPQSLHPVIPGPGKEDTDRFASNWDVLSEGARRAADARRLFPSTLNGVEFIIKFFLRPANDLMSCMLLSTGRQVFWRLANHCGGEEPRLELVWRTSDIAETTLCIMTITTPDIVPDKEMTVLVESLRTGYVIVNEEGNLSLDVPVHQDFTYHYVGIRKLVSRVSSAYRVRRASRS